MKNRNEQYLGSTVNQFYNPWETTFSSGVRKTVVFTVGANKVNGDFSTPNAHYFQKIQRNALQGVYEQVGGIASGHARQVSTGLHVNMNQHAGNIQVPIMPNYMFTNAYNKALGDLNNDVRGSLDLSVTFGQIGLTRQMIWNAMRVVRYARDLRKSLKISPFKAIGSKWLEYTYGWAPLVQDVYTLAYSLSGNKVCWIDFVGRGLDRAEVRDTVYDPYLLVDRITTFRARCEVSVRLAPSLSRLQAMSNFSSLNPVSIAWELMPWSFVIDWFYDVGGYIRNLETAMLHNSRFIHGYVTYGEKTDVKLKQHGTVSASGSKRIYAYTGGAVRTMKDRAILTSYPFPRIPVVSVDLGSGRLANAAALLTTFLHGKRAVPERYRDRLENKILGAQRGV